MIVCVCNNIRENELREAAARGGCRTACQSYKALGHRAKCGQCIRFARTIISEARNAA
ncbi:MAG: (2Fe-2S)-binding protein [Sphingomonas sp.]|jgi:bacterioferritin-associated ferredoxin|uniref:(2Fe-2S)-binding protein n=1 Tax=Sphingomonas sp. TaxID=28214 RepID=UPI0025CC7229|nr:(2Fe-2S)-binding protein [Sphingomonas sp.]MBX9882610.1 (2Fe-2S)-binding protein [Sphingomonas sp.]